MYIRFPLSLRNVEDLLHERGIDICYEAVRYWWQRFGPMFAAEIRKRRVTGIRSTLKFLKKTMKKHGPVDVFVTDKPRSYGAVLKDLGMIDRQETGPWLNNRAENSQLPFRSAMISARSS